MQLKLSPGKIEASTSKQPRLALIFWIIAGLLSGLALLSLVLIQPQLGSSYNAEQLSQSPRDNLWQAEGFYTAQRDPEGNLYVWSRPTMRFTLNFEVQGQVQLNFQLRSPTVVGGPSDPIVVRVNGREVDRIQLNPQAQSFQTVSVRLNEVSGPNLKVELLSTAFQPSQNDGRMLGTIVKSAELDLSQARSRFEKRLWLVMGWPLLALLSLGLVWLYHKRGLQWAVYSAHGVALLAFGEVMVGLVGLVQLGVFSSFYSIWVIALLYLAGLSLFGSLIALPGSYPSLLGQRLWKLRLGLPRRVRVAYTWFLILATGGGLLYGRYNWNEANGYYAAQGYFASLYFFLLSIPACYYLILLLSGKRRPASGITALFFLVYALPYQWLGLNNLRYNLVYYNWRDQNLPAPSTLLTWFPGSVGLENFPADKLLLAGLWLLSLGIGWLVLRQQPGLKWRGYLLKLGPIAGLFLVILLQTWLHSSVHSPYSYTAHLEQPPQVNYWFHSYMFEGAKGAVNSDAPYFTTLNDFFNGLPKEVNTLLIRRSYIHYLTASPGYIFNVYYAFIVLNTLIWLAAALCTYDFIKRVLQNRRIALYTAALVGVGNGFIYFVAQPMSYLANFALIIFSFWACERILIREKLDFGHVVLFGLILGLLSSTYDLFQVYPVLLLYAIWRKASWWKTILSLVAAYLFYSGFLFVVFNILRLTENEGNSKFATGPFGHILNLMKSFRLTEIYELLIGLLKSYVQTLGYATLLLTLVLGLAGWIMSSERKEKSLIGLLLLPSALLFVYLYLGDETWGGARFAEIPRFSYIAYPGLYLGIAVLLTKLTDLAQKFRWLDRVTPYLPWLVIGLVFIWHNIDIFGYPSLYYHFYWPLQNPWLLDT